MKLLNKIQQTIKAPKTQWNPHGKFKYRSCSDILGAAKPLLGTALLTMTDDMVQIGERYYIKATVTLEHEGEKVVSYGFAREAAEQKGMNAGQLSCSTSSYARKVALNGLFAIDDSLDAGGDTNGNGGDNPDAVWKSAYDKYVAQFSKGVEKGKVIDFEKFQDAVRAEFARQMPDVQERSKFAFTVPNIKPFVVAIKMEDTLKDVDAPTN